VLRGAVVGWARIAICAACFSGLGGCAIVKIVDADGTEEVRVQPIATNPLSAPASGPRLVKVTALGISTTSRGVDVGLREEDIVVAPAACHAVLVVRTEAQAESAAKLARHVNESCIVRR
jgi:hypothetical protein